MRITKLVVLRHYKLVLVSLILASCATKEPTSIAYGKHDIGIDGAFVLPADRSVVGITQEHASNAITQTIALNTNSGLPGENFYRVVFYGPVNSKGGSEKTLSYMALTDGKISRELRTEMAGVAMSRSPYYVQNNYGPFSYATGKAPNGDSCIYAWQQIRSPESSQIFFQNRGRIDLRLRLCEAGASSEQLLASMYEFTINSTIAANGWNPYGEPASPSPQLGRPGNPLLAPSVNSNLSGPFPAADLNTDRLNTTILNPERNFRSENAAPAPKKIPTNQRSRADGYYAPPVQTHFTTEHSSTPVTVPAPQAGGYVVPHPTIITPPTPVPPQIQVPSPQAVSSNPTTNTAQEKPAVRQVTNAPAITVPSPCRFAAQATSTATTNNDNTLCPL